MGLDKNLKKLLTAAAAVAGAGVASEAHAQSDIPLLDSNTPIHVIRKNTTSRAEQASQGKPAPYVVPAQEGSPGGIPRSNLEASSAPDDAENTAGPGLFQGELHNDAQAARLEAKRVLERGSVLDRLNKNHKK